MGSSLFNLLILAIADLVHRSRGTLLSRVAAAPSLSGTVTIGLTALAGMVSLPSLSYPTVFRWSLALV